MSKHEFDVVVAGAGMVGASAALALARNGLKIALIEAAPPPKFEADADYDLRVSAISPRSRGILERYGVWRQLYADRVCYYEKMHIWHQNGGATVDFDAVELARDYLGAIVENRLLQTTLHRSCESDPGIEWFMPDSIEAITSNDVSGVELRLNSGIDLSGALLIAADGRGSPTRRLAGIDIDQGPYRQSAIVANVDTEYAHEHTAWQRFLATGPLAFLPLANGQSSIVWSCDSDFAAEVTGADDEHFCAALGDAFEHTLGAVTGCGARLSFPLGWHSCDRWLQGRVLLIGDAAHGVHPLAGQGVNLGFSDVDLLASLITDATRLAPQKYLRRYERQRKSETWLATQGLSALKWIYGFEQAPLTGIRDLGMRAVENTPWFKRSMMLKAIQNLT